MWKAVWTFLKSPMVREAIAIIVITVGEEVIRQRKKYGRPQYPDDESEFRGW